MDELNNREIKMLEFYNHNTTGSDIPITKSGFDSVGGSSGILESLSPEDDFKVLLYNMFRHISRTA